MELENKTIIIAGASSGIGAAAAELFASEGANLVLGARRKTELYDVTNQITKNGGNAICLVGDVTDEAYSVALVELANTKFGGLNGAFNNAGTVGEMGPVEDMATATWDDVIATNLTSAFYAAKAQIPAMKSNKGGSIVFTSSFLSALAMAACRAWVPMLRPKQA